MSKSRLFLYSSLVALCALSRLPAGNTQSNPARLKVLVIKTRDSAFYNPAAQGLTNGLKTRGFRSGERVEIKTIALKGQPDADSQNIRDQITKRPNLIITLGTDATRIVAEQKPTCPVLFSMVLDPVSLGVVKSLDAPGGNFTGNTLLVSPGKQLDTLLQTVPTVKRVAVLYTEGDATSQAFLQEARQDAGRLHIEIAAIPVSAGQSAREIWKNLPAPPDAIWIIPDPASTGQQAFAETMEYARAHRLPALGASGATVRAGALLALSASIEDLGDVTAEMAVYLLDGTEQAAKMRVRGPRRTLLTVNLPAAAAIGLKIPEAVLRLADEVVENMKEEER